MRIIGSILLIVVIVFVCLMTKWDDFVLYYLVVPVVAIIVGLIIAITLKKYKPEWFERNWPYMSDEEKQKFLQKHKQNKKR